jgi:hypothetical protein
MAFPFRHASRRIRKLWWTIDEGLFPRCMLFLLTSIILQNLQVCQEENVDDGECGIWKVKKKNGGCVGESPILVQEKCRRGQPSIYVDGGRYL